MRHFELVRKCKFVFLSNRSFQEVIGTYIHNIMCDNAISKQIRHILSHNFHSVQFIPVMLRAFVATLVRVFYLYATNSLFYGLSFSVFFSFLHDQALNVSLHIIIIHKDKTTFLVLPLRGIIEPMFTSFSKNRHFKSTILIFACQMISMVNNIHCIFQNL